MAGYTSHYSLKKLNSGDSLSDDGYKFTDPDRDTIDLLLYLAGEAHHHTGGGSGGTTTPTEAANVTLVTNSGVLPAGRRVYYEYTYVDATGVESGASPEVFIDTPSQVSSPAKPTLTSVTTGGALAPGNYYYVLSAYTGSSGYETPAVNPETILVTSSTLTNTITLTLPALPAGATGFNVYRQAPGGPGYFFIAAIDMSSVPTTWDDTGAIAPNCDRTRPTVNTTRQTNSVTLTLPGTAPSLAPGQSWRIYRSYTSGEYVNSLLATVTDITYTDTGTATTVGQPPFGAVSVGSPAQVLLTNGSEVQGRLPLANISAFPETVTFAMDGDTFELTGTNVWVCEYPQATIVGVRASLGRGYVPTNQAVIIDVNKGSGPVPTMTSIFAASADQPRILVGQQIGARVAPTATMELVEGDVLTIDVDQADDANPSTDQDLTVNIYLYCYGWTETTSHEWATP